MQQPKVLTVVGPTSSGKTSLSIKLAQKFDGEVISADSRQVYRGMDLGTGKVTEEEMAGVPHHLLDVANPADVYTAADFKRDATAALLDIQKRGRLPIIAGGTFFYVDTLLGRISTPDVPPNEQLRTELEQLSTDDLFTKLEAADPRRAADIDRHNRRRLIRALEIVDAIGSVPPPTPEEQYDVLALGIDIPAETLHHNIHTRLLQRLEAGMLTEVKQLHTQGVSWERMEEVGLEYRYCARHLQDQITYDEMITELETKTKQFAKRQLTWLKRDASIVWIDPTDTEIIFSTITNWLND